VKCTKEYIGYRGRPISPGPYYHGTSTALNIQHKILPPEKTKVQTERRIQRLNKVFFTNNIEAAWHYAKKASKKWGNNPCVFTIEPCGKIKQMSGEQSLFGPVFYADYAEILGLPEIWINKK